MLIICKDCGGKVSSMAQCCPHCGCPVPQNIETMQIQDTPVYFCAKCGVSGVKPWWKNKSYIGSGCYFCHSHLIGMTTETEREILQMCLQEETLVTRSDNPDPVNNWIMVNYVVANNQYDERVAQRRIFIQYKRKLCASNIDAIAKKEREEYIHRAEASKPKCPNCHSTNISKISTLSRAASVSLFGLASSKVGKTMQCNKCGYKW